VEKNFIIRRHSGFLKTYQRVKNKFGGDGLKSDFLKFVIECFVCQEQKLETINTLVILQPLTIPSQRWTKVSMYFITCLLKFEGKSVIMVVVDRLTKYSHFCALSHPSKSRTLIMSFIETVQKLDGTPNIK
jgi:hypothetical protein